MNYSRFCMNKCRRMLNQLIFVLVLRGFIGGNRVASNGNLSEKTVVNSTFRPIVIKPASHKLLHSGTNVSNEVSRKFDVDYSNDPSSWIPSTVPPTTQSSTNLAILPVLAVLVFLTFVCLKCCSWFRTTLKERDGEEIYDQRFVILEEGDTEYKDVEIRSDTTSSYDTVSSYTSFIKRSNQYDTVTSVRSLQSPKQLDTYNSYRSFLLQRLECSRYNTVSSYRSFLRNAVEMKDVEVQVDLVDMAPSTKKVRANQHITRPTVHRHYSCDAILTKTKNISDRTSRYTKRSHQNHVCFVDNPAHNRVAVSRSLSLADGEKISPSDKVQDKRHEKQASVSPVRSLKQLWGIRLFPRELQTDNSGRLSPSRVYHQNTACEAKTHRFKVYKTDETDLGNNLDSQRVLHSTTPMEDKNHMIETKYPFSNAKIDLDSPNEIQSGVSGLEIVGEIRHAYQKIAGNKRSQTTPAYHTHQTVDSVNNKLLKQHDYNVNNKMLEQHDCNVTNKVLEQHDWNVNNTVLKQHEYINADENNLDDVQVNTSNGTSSPNLLIGDSMGFEVTDTVSISGSDDTDSGVCNELTTFGIIVDKLES